MLSFKQWLDAGQPKYPFKTVANQKISNSIVSPPIEISAKAPSEVVKQNEHQYLRQTLKQLKETMRARLANKVHQTLI